MLFPIVGIGASAGGLEAMEQFLRNVPDESGMAYVMVQHLDPTHKGMLPELLQRITRMKVFQAKDNMVVNPNCVYVIPPNKSMSILHGKLHLFKPLESRGLRLPVDFFLRSLAEDRKEWGIGLILSGMGSDGSTDIATLFLDKELNIRRYTNQATKIFKLIKSDIGRPFTDQVSDLIYPEMAEDANEVLRTLVFVEKQIPGKDGKWFSIRLMPYRTFDDRIDGLVITFIDISELKRVEEQSGETLQIQSLLLNTSTDVVIKLSTDWNILEFNPEAEKFFGVKRENAIKNDYFQMFVPESSQGKTRKVLKKLLNNLQDGRLKTEVIAAKGNTAEVFFSVKVLLNNMNDATGVVLMGEWGG